MMRRNPSQSSVALGSRWPSIFGVGLYKPLMMVTVMVTMGVGFGSLAVRRLNPLERNQLIGFMNRFGESVLERRGELGEAAALNLGYNLQKLGIQFLLSAVVIGIPLVLVLLFLHGFAAGFTVGFMIDQFGAGGIALSAASVYLQQLFVIVPLAMAGMVGIAYGVAFFTAPRGKKGSSTPSRLFRLGLVFAVAGCLMVPSFFVEAYLSPALVRFVLSFLG